MDDAARDVGFDGAVVHLVDHEQDALHALPPADPGTPVPIDGTMAGRVFASGTPQAAADRAITSTISGAVRSRQTSNPSSW